MNAPRRLARLLLASLAMLLMFPVCAQAQSGDPSATSFSLQKVLEGLRLDTSLSTDSNVTRSNLRPERLSDQAVGVQLSGSKTLPVGGNGQMVFSGFVGLEQWRRFRGLGKAYIGGEAEYQYRVSEEFDAPTYGVNLGATAEDFQSGLRDGLRVSFGANVRVALTDRINFFGAVARNTRTASSAVFDTSDNSIRFNLDYALAATQTLYLSGEYRRGDIVSSGLPSLANLNLAKVLVADDAFRGIGFRSYRIAGRTVLLTLGYNIALGTQDALDLSWRRVRSDPSASPGVPVGGPSFYLSNQIALVYLKSF